MERTVEVSVGYAAGAAGNGVVYARVADARGERLARIGFRVSPASGERVIPYAALFAVARALERRGMKNVRFTIPDAGFVNEIMGVQPIDQALAIPYVRLRCALNSLVKFDVTTGAADDLIQRARAEAALNVAA
jgi:hypothetical protein